MFPVILNADEILCLRLMLRTTMARRTLESCEEYKLKLKALKPDESQEPADIGFVKKSLMLQDTYRNLDIILYQAQVKSAEKKDTVIIQLGTAEFGALKAVAFFRYFTDTPQDPTAFDTMERIVRHQDRLRAAFDVSESKNKADPTPNQLLQPVNGKNLLN